MLRILGLAAILLASGCAQTRFYLHYASYFNDGPKPRTECGENSGFRYCLHKAPKGVLDDPGSILYFLHYAGGDERSWSRIPISRVYYAELKKRGLPAPQVVTVSYGPHWNLFNKPGARHPVGLFGEFTGKVMPFLENSLGGPARRYIWGMSQGGLNGSLLVLKRPDLWSAAVFSCPAWFTFPVFAGEPEIASYESRNRSDPKKVRWVLNLIKERVEGPSEWAIEDPLQRARSAQKLPPVYINCTRGDEYGFFEGASAMAETLRKAGQDVTFFEEKGAHCQLDAVKASAYLAEKISVFSSKPAAR